MIDAKIPAGPLETKWKNYKSTVRLVNPANKRKLEVIVIGTGLAGASAAASLGELGYKVKAFCSQDSPRRAHSIAARAHLDRGPHGGARPSTGASDASRLSRAHAR